MLRFLALDSRAFKSTCFLNLAFQKCTRLLMIVMTVPSRFKLTVHSDISTENPPELTLIYRQASSTSSISYYVAESI